MDERWKDRSARVVGPRVLSDGSVFLNSYGCTFYRLSEIGSNHPRLETFFALDTPSPEPGEIRGSFGIPVVVGNYWINPVGQLHAVVVLDIANPARPREVCRHCQWKTQLLCWP